MAMVTDFDDSIYDDGQDMFDCDYTSIDEIINQIIVFTGVTERETENGMRTLVAFEKEDGTNSCFWTDSKRLKEVLHHPERIYPFRAIIKVTRWGKYYGFKFVSPKSEITQDDIDNFNFYQRNKYRKRR